MAAPTPWRKSPPELIALFDAALPKDQRIERRKMFGYPAAFVNGYLFTGLHQENLMLRLAEDACEQLCASGEAAPFIAMGRRMRNYVVLAPAVLADRAGLDRLLAQSLAFAAALPPKPKKPAKRRPRI